MQAEQSRAGHAGEDHVLVKHPVSLCSLEEGVQQPSIDEIAWNCHIHMRAELTLQ